MRIGIISDIHGDVNALRMTLEQMGPVHHILCAGDMVLQYRFSNEVVDLLRRDRVLAVRGNHEEAILGSGGAPLRASGAISPENLAYLEGLPPVLEMMIERRRVIMRHTSPLDPTGGGRELRTEPHGTYYTSVPSADFDPASDPEFDPFWLSNGATIHLAKRSKLYPEGRADVLIVGHTHLPVVAYVGSTLVVNPGSLAQPRDVKNPSRRTYAVLDTDTWEASIAGFHLPL